MDGYVVGYGSLINPLSRQQTIAESPAVPVYVDGWSREWSSRHYEELQTYVGAYATSSSRLNGVLVPASNADLQALAERERYYRLESVPRDNVSVFAGHNLDPLPIWIWEATEHIDADDAFPVSQTYIDTCIQGCISVAGKEFAMDFVRLTCKWNTPIANDRCAPRYVRRTNVSEREHIVIDELLKDGLL